MNFNNIIELSRADMQAVNDLILRRLRSDVVLVNQLGQYIINSGGKRLRPLLALLVARACGYEGDKHIQTAAIVEFIHTATLLHDDVVDESNLRRGKETANSVWGNQAAVLVGDFLYSRSFQMMVDLGSMRVMDILSHTTNTIAEGEVLQLMNCHDPDTTEESYMEVIYSKTAKLFEAACQLGAVLAEKPEADEKAMAAYGIHLGTAFQLVDDVMDYSASSDDMGKNVGDDLAEGKPTLPLIVAMREGTETQKQTVRKAIEEGGLELIDEVLEAIQATKALEYTLEVAKQEAQKAVEQLTCLPESDYKAALEHLAWFSVERSH